MRHLLADLAIGSFLFSTPALFAQASPVDRQATDPSGYKLRDRFDDLYSGKVAAAAVTYASTTNIDLAAAGYQTVTLTGNVTLTTSNRVAGKTCIVRLIASGGSRNLTLPAWVNTNAAPSALASGKTGIFIIRCFGTGVGDIVASYVVQP